MQKGYKEGSVRVKGNGERKKIKCFSWDSSTYTRPFLLPPRSNFCPEKSTQLYSTSLPSVQSETENTRTLKLTEFQRILVSLFSYITLMTKNTRNKQSL